MTDNQFEEMPQEQLSDADLVAAYRNGEASSEPVMLRVLDKIGLAHRGQEHLNRFDGTPLADKDGKPVRTVDYLDAAETHEGAAAGILNFVLMDEADPDYRLACETMVSMVSMALPPEQDREK